jgi:hypothetical protein
VGIAATVGDLAAEAHGVVGAGELEFDAQRDEVGGVFAAGFGAD